jgi:hypothetical protein
MARATASATVKSAPTRQAKGATVVKTKQPAAKATAKAKVSAKKMAPKMAAAPSKKSAAKPPAAPVKKKKAALAKAASSPKAAQPKKIATKKAATPRKPATPGKSASRARAAQRPVPAKKAASRRPTARVSTAAPAARRGRVPVAPRKVAPTKLRAAAGSQSYTVSHLNEAEFKADGLRTYALYRDLGIAGATAGLCQAHVIRFVPPCTDAVRKRHLHSTELQLVYVLQGWIKNEFEGIGEQMMSVGSCWLQPSGIEHTVLDYSPDCELLEIIVPAEFDTREV